MPVCTFWLLYPVSTSSCIPKNPIDCSVILTTAVISIQRRKTSLCGCDRRVW